MTTQWATFLACVLILTFSTTTSAIDYSLWDRILKTHVSRGTKHDVELNLLDYSGINENPDFHEFIRQIESTDTSNFSHNEFLAFYVNAYNAYAVKTVIDHGCKEDSFGKCGGSITSIRQGGNFISPVWGKKIGVIDGKDVTLDEVEGELRAPANWPEDCRIHAAIVCASVSCPDLRAEAYIPSRVDWQLTDNMRSFLANPKKGMKVDQDSGDVHLSSIFKWFEGDFKTCAGNNATSALPFVTPFVADQSDRAFLEDYGSTKKISVKHFGYDWSVNAQGDVPCKHPSSRPCFPVWGIIVTSVGVFLLLLVGVIVGVCVYCKCYRRRSYEVVE